MCQKERATQLPNCDVCDQWQLSTLRLRTQVWRDVQMPRERRVWVFESATETLPGCTASKMNFAVPTRGNADGDGTGVQILSSRSIECRWAAHNSAGSLALSGSTSVVVQYDEFAALRTLKGPIHESN